jgi:uncharacterized protein DUF4405
MMKRSDLNFFIDAVAFLGLVLLVSTGLIMRFVLPPFQGGRSGEVGPSTLWGWGRHQWGEIHFWIAAGILVIMVVHLFLHWKWIASVFQGKPREGSGIRVSLGILSLILLMIFAASPFFSPTELKPRRGKHATSEYRLEKPVDDKPSETKSRSEKQAASVTSEVKPIEEKKTVPKPSEIPVDSDLTKKKEEKLPVSEFETLVKGIKGRTTLREIEETTGVPVAYVLEKLGLPDDTDPENRLGRLRRQYGFKMHAVREIVEKYQQ